MNLSTPSIALAVRNVAETRLFYRDILGGSERRSDSQSVEFDLYGQRIACHLGYELGHLDGQVKPATRYSIAVENCDWKAFARRMTRQRVRFVMELNFEGGSSDTSKEASFVLLDPTGNTLEFRFIRRSSVHRSFDDRASIGYWLFSILLGVALCWGLLRARTSAEEHIAEHFAAPVGTLTCAPTGLCGSK
jgi:extradiol dioxygenase family protein